MSFEKSSKSKLLDHDELSCRVETVRLLEKISISLEEIVKAINRLSHK